VNTKTIITMSTAEILSQKIEALTSAIRNVEEGHFRQLSGPSLSPTSSPTTIAPTVSFSPTTRAMYYTILDGDTAWMLTSVALVLMMTMPGLAIYYGGMVGSKNVLAVIMQVFSITCLITVLWLCFGYSLAFCPSGFFQQSNDTINHTLIYGDDSRFWLRGMDLNTVNAVLANTIPESVYCAFQLTFAIITAALICGSFADRMRYWPMMVFIGFWHLCVYCPIAHCMWHPYGLLNKMGVLDYAGGNVVHISSGVAGLMAALIVGNRKGWKPKSYDSHPPHNILITYVGMSMLWVGCFGFNAGSAVNAGPNAGFAMMATQIATATASLSWMLTEVYFRKKPSVLGMVNGAIAGLVAITPASGYVDMTGAFFTGLFGGSLCYFGAQLKHHVFKIDDALDAFGVHAIGGICGGICTGFFASTAVDGNTDHNGVFYSSTWIGGHQLAKQLVGITFSIAWSGIGSFILLKIIDLTMGLRVSEAEEEEGLDTSLHGETIVDPEKKGDLKSARNPIVDGEASI
jgi:Amt family ammonium transporter